MRLAHLGDKSDDDLLTALASAPQGARHRQQPCACSALYRTAASAGLDDAIHSYALGVTAGESKRTARDHEAFADAHRRLLGVSSDEGLQALLRFLETWPPEDFARLSWPEEMKDQNIVFALESERLRNICIHDRPAARTLWARPYAERDKREAASLVTGERSLIARLHPAIKGVWGAQTSAPRSYPSISTPSPPTATSRARTRRFSKGAAFAYTTALNRFLERGSGVSAPVVGGIRTAVSVSVSPIGNKRFIIGGLAVAAVLLALIELDPTPQRAASPPDDLTLAAECVLANGDPTLDKDGRQMCRHPEHPLSYADDCVRAGGHMDYGANGYECVR